MRSAVVILFVVMFIAIAVGGMLGDFTVACVVALLVLVLTCVWAVRWCLADRWEKVSGRNLAFIWFFGGSSCRCRFSSPLWRGRTSRPCYVSRGR